MDAVGRRPRAKKGLTYEDDRVVRNCRRRAERHVRARGGHANQRRQGADSGTEPLGLGLWGRAALRLQFPWNLTVEPGTLRNRLFRDPLQREPELAALFRPAILGGDAADQPDLRMRRLRRHPADHWSALTRHRRHLLLVPAGEAAPRLPVPGARREPAAIRQREYHARPDRLLGS